MRKRDYFIQSIPLVKCMLWADCLTRVVAGAVKMRGGKEEMEEEIQIID